MSRTISNGDCVRLKSGGPVMTVASREYTREHEWVCYCCWFNGNADISKAPFPEYMLAQVKEVCDEH